MWCPSARLVGKVKVLGKAQLLNPQLAALVIFEMIESIPVEAPSRSLLHRCRGVFAREGGGAPHKRGFRPNFRTVLEEYGVRPRASSEK